MSCYNFESSCYSKLADGAKVVQYRPRASMSSEFVFGTYELYKADTRNFINWLVTHAEISGYRLPSAATWQAAGTKASPEKAASQTTFNLSVSQYAALPQAIAQSVDPTILVPPWVIRIVEDVIESRKLPAQHWSTQVMEDASVAEKVKAGNQRHSYFIDVLEKVRRVLRTRKREQTTRVAELSPQSHESSTTSGSTFVLRNAFQALGV